MTTGGARGWLALRWEALLTKALVLVAVVVFVKLAIYIDRPVVDDALISIAYGKSLFGGNGFRVTPSSAIAEGFSNPTWTLVLGLLERFHVNSVEPAKTIGMLLSASALPLLMLWGPTSQKRGIRLEDAVAPLFACTNGTFVYWALGGLENGILVFLVALFGVLVWAPRTRRVAIALGLTGAALALTRPEAPLYVVVIALPWLGEWLWAARLRPKPTRDDVLAFAVLAAPVLLYVLFRRAYFRAWLPNTYYAKHTWFLDFTRERLRGLVNAYLLGFRVTIMPLLWASGAGIVLSCAGRWRVVKSAAAALGVAGTMVLFVWVAKTDWMMEYRFLSTAVPFLAYPIGTGITGVRSLLAEPWLERRRYLRWAVHAVVAAAVVFALHASTKKHEERWAGVKAQGGDTPRAGKDRPGWGSDVRQAMGPIRMTHPLLAAPDMGYISLGLREYEIVDLAGLTDVTLARHYGNLAAMRDFMGNEGYPTLLLMWGPSSNLWPMVDVLAKYRSTSVASSYKIYKNVTPDADDRCPDGKPAALVDTAADMQSRIRQDLAEGRAVKALARWRCYLAYRRDADLPSMGERVAIAREAASIADGERDAKRWEPALRGYSLCAVMGASSWTPGSSCRMRAETIRGQLFPRPKPPAP